MRNKGDVVEGVSGEVEWWVAQRMHKLREALLDSMSINPFLLPAIYDLHHSESFEELGSLLLAGHLMVGHATGFGKLIDEKILPKVFGTTKLSGSLRAQTPPLQDSCFDDIDHLIDRSGGIALLSLKASRWTIQLASAVNLNRSFAEILERYGDQFKEIVVGVIYGKHSDLTDKYDILRGVNRGRNHSVQDLTDRVEVFSGRGFWSWLNEGAADTQTWVMEGIVLGLEKSNCREESKELLVAFAKAFNEIYAIHIRADGSVDWHQLLASIND